MPITRRVGLLGAILLAGFAQAEVVFSTYGPNYAYDPVSAYFIGSVNPPTHQFGFRFVPSRSGTLTELRAALYSSGSSLLRPVRLTLYRDDGTLPGWSIASSDALLTRGQVGQVFPPSVINLGSEWRVAARQAYYVAIHYPNFNGSCEWHAAGTNGTRIPGTQIWRWDLQTPWQRSTNSEMPAFELRIDHPCFADFDDGSASGTPDGGVTIDDLLYYTTIFADGLPSADLDDGTMTGTPDGGVTAEDLLFFLARYAEGC